MLNVRLLCASFLLFSSLLLPVIASAQTDGGAKIVTGDGPTPRIRKDAQSPLPIRVHSPEERCRLRDRPRP